jgi:hypothetical protein
MGEGLVSTHSDRAVWSDLMRFGGYWAGSAIARVRADFSLHLNLLPSHARLPSQPARPYNHTGNMVILSRPLITTLAVWVYDSA